MSIRFLKENSLNDLYEDIDKNIERYRSIGFYDIFEDSAMTYSHDGLTFDLEKMGSLTGGVESDSTNSTILLEAMPGMTPYLAKDERVWAYLCHTVFFKYINERWPIPVDASVEKVIQHIKLHFFARTDRNFERDNAGSRLWWGAFFASNIDNMKYKDAIETYHMNQDYKGHLIGRPASSSSLNLFGILLEAFRNSLNGDGKLTKRENYKEYLKEVNLLGGRRLIPVMTSLEIKDELRIIENKVLGKDQSNTTDPLSKLDLSEKLLNELIEFDINVISKIFPNTPDENKILNDDNLARFVAYKPIDTSEFLDLECFPLEVRDKLSPQGEFLKEILKIIDNFIEENY